MAEKLTDAEKAERRHRWLTQSRPTQAVDTMLAKAEALLRVLPSTAPSPYSDRAYATYRARYDLEQAVREAQHALLLARRG